MQTGEVQAYLFELRGESPGTVREVREGVIRLGSDAENEVVLTGAGISLFQAEIRATGKECMLRNLSGQGQVFLNGETFVEAELKRGDLLTIGDTIFRVVFPGEALARNDLWRPVGGKQSVPSPPTSPMRRASFLTLVTLFAVVIALVVMLAQRKGKEPEAPLGDKVTGFDAAVDLKDLKELYTYAAGLISARRWDQALLSFEEVRRTAPNYKDTEVLYQQALQESVFLDDLTLAKGLLMEGNLADAKLRLEKIPETSLYSRESLRYLHEIESRLEETQLAEAEQYLARGELDRARTIARSFLSAGPNARARKVIQEADLQQLRKRGGSYPVLSTSIEPLVTQKEAVIPAESARLAAAARRAAKLPKPTLPRGAVQGTPEWHFQEAAVAYHEGDTNGSLQFLTPLIGAGTTSRPDVQAKAGRMIEDLHAAEAYHARARALQEQGRYEEAVETWESFLEADKRILGAVHGAYHESASAQLCKIYFRRGKEAFDRGNLVDASRFWNMAERVNAEDPEVQRGLARLDASAVELYREGYAVQDINPAIASERWQTVLEIVPPWHPYYKKAKEGIEWCRGRVGHNPDRLRQQGAPAAVPQQGAPAADNLPRALYLEGYALWDVNPELAIAKWRELLSKTSREDPYNQKARKLIESFEETR